MGYEEIKQFYTTQLNTSFIPYWETKIDFQYGGVFSCIQNDADEIVSQDKYIWSQGRFLWIASKLLEKKERYVLNGKWEDAAEKTYTFLRKNAVMTNGHIVNAVAKDGTHLEDEMDNSIFADCFYVLGCNAYAQFTKDSAIYEHAKSVYKQIKRRIEEDTFQSEPYPIPKGFQSHSIPMILINVTDELYSSSVQFNDPESEQIREHVKLLFLQITQKHIKEKRIVEMMPNHSEDEDTLLYRHINPGHTLECLWFLNEALQHFPNEEKKALSHEFIRLIKDTVEIGWDQQFGGLFRFVDETGGIPKGRCIDDRFEQLILDTWDTKLWWPHSEALYTVLLYSIQSDDEELERWYEKIEKYCFEIFPSPDGLEWIQIRSRAGEPVRKTVALPVKDPFHIMRNFIKIIDLVEGVQ
ncbi:AGE family epimerase/isomerase [Sporosarcina koreensis]|uniref:AGE family epimerase/isomerase n=1 Tax=Bacillales TaxID=1385 RepID=UPI000756B2E1|nr:AGE family epimerase/isomerase [Sporosarcina koreensis]